MKCCNMSGAIVYICIYVCVCVEMLVKDGAVSDARAHTRFLYYVCV